MIDRPHEPTCDVIRVHAATTRESPQLNIRTPDARLRYILRTEALRKGETLSEYVTQLLWTALKHNGLVKKYREIFGDVCG